MNAPASGNWLDQHGTNHLTPSASRPTATEGVTFAAAADGQTVRRWLDKSGNLRHLDQATLANQPTLTNASTGLTFNGISSFLATVQNIAPPSGSFSLFAVVTTPSNSDSFRAIFGHGYTVPEISTGIGIYIASSGTSIDWVAGDFICYGSGYGSATSP
jgi:hypothetical protein